MLKMPSVNKTDVTIVFKVITNIKITYKSLLYKEGRMSQGEQSWVKFYAH